MRRADKIALWLVILPIALLGSRYVWLRTHSNAAVRGGARSIAYYQDSMHPWIKSESPGKCTICEMALTPVYEGENGFSIKPGTVVLSSNNLTILQVQSEKIQRQTLTNTLRLGGTFALDETRKTVISAPASGRIQVCNVESAGMAIAKGQPMFTLFSSELVQRRAYLRSVGGDQSSLGKGLVQAGGNDPYLGELLAPQSGVILEKFAYAGQYVMEGEKLFTLVDPSTVWFRFDVYDRQIAWIKTGQRLEITSAGLPGKKIIATITFVEPAVNELTRTIKARAVLVNPLVTNNGVVHRLLPLEMYAEAAVSTCLTNTLAVPRSALLFDGSTAYVYLDNEDCSFSQRRVELGLKGDDFYEITSGLSEGDRVVTSGNVLLDSQAHLTSSHSPLEMSPLDHRQSPKKESSPEEIMDINLALPVASAEPMPETKMAPAMNHQAMTNLPSGSAEPLSKSSQAAIARSSVMAAIMSPGTELQSMRRASIMKGLVEDSAMATNKMSPQEVLTQVRRQTLQGLVQVTKDMGGRLAVDDLRGFYQHACVLPTVFTQVREYFPAADPLYSGLQRVIANGLPVARAGDWQMIKNISAARTIFAPFSDAMVALVPQLKAQDPIFGDLIVYRYAALTNQPVWLQTSAPPSNPFLSGPGRTNGVEVVP